MQQSSYGCTREVAKHERSETLASFVLSKPPKCIHNSMVARCTLTISFYNIKTFKHLSSRVEIFIEIRSSYMKQNYKIFPYFTSKKKPQTGIEL